MPEPLGWARLWALARPTTDPMLRQGAWYAIIERRSETVTVECRSNLVTIPEHLVEVRARRPDRFTVVYRSEDDPNPFRGTARDLGRVYAVCPACGARVRLAGNPDRAHCTSCGHRGQVAWWETG